MRCPNCRRCILPSRFIGFTHLVTVEI